MKKKIIKIWGIGMIVVLLSSLLVVGATPAGADSLAWSNVLTLPSGLTNQLAAGVDVANVKVAPNGDLFAVDSASATGDVYKSTDGGRTWVASVPAAAPFVDLAISPSYTTDNTLVALAAGQVYISVDGGMTFNPLGNTLPAGENGTCIAISPNYVYPTGEIMVGTEDPGIATYGDVYIWGRLGVLTWTAMGLGEDVTSVAYSTNYLIDATRLAVGSDATPQTRLHTLVASDAAFDNTLATVAVINAAGGTGDAAAIVSSNIALPTDFNASVAFGRTCYVSTISGLGTDNVYRLSVGSGLAAVPLNPGAAIPYADHEMTSLIHVGAYASGMLYAGDLNSTLVFQTSNPTLPAGFTTWTFCLAAPSGVGTTYVALAADYATSNTVYAGTADGGAGNSALSISDDGGVYFYQTGLIDTAIDAINDYVAASPTEFYMVTSDTTAANVESLWKSVDGGATWYRVMSVATAANNGQVRLSQNYATDNTLVFLNVTAAAAAPPAPSQFYVSMDGGATWVGRNVAGAFNIADMIVKDAYTYYVGSSAAAQVQSTTNGGWVWQAVPTALAGGTAVYDMAYDAGTGHILVGDTGGGVYLSTNANATYLAQGAFGGTNTIIAFDASYGTNNIIYAADSSGVTDGVQRYNTTTPLIPWAVIDGGATVLPADIVCTPDGALYATDATSSTVAAPIAGGMQRSLNPTAVVPAFETVSGGDGLAATSQLGKMTVTEGSNIIYALNNFGGLGVTVISTYTDILTMAVPVITSPSEGDILLAGAAVVAITPVANNPLGTYQVQWNTRADYLGTGNILAIPFVINSVNLNTAGAPLPAGATIYIRVQVTGPVMGPWSDTVSFETQLTTGAINAPAIIPPVGGAGNTGPGGFDAALNPTFNWGPIGGATGYEFQMAMDASFADPIIDYTGDDALGNVLVYQLTTMTLDYSTTYYWRVKGISTTSETAWSAAVGFTTMDKPVETEPPVTVTDAPDITITMPDQPTPTTVTFEPAPIEETAQGYIWAIIIIGAVLVIAVIVLIVRTRRSV